MGRITVHQGIANMLHNMDGMLRIKPHMRVNVPMAGRVLGFLLRRVPVATRSRAAVSARRGVMPAATNSTYGVSKQEHFPGENTEQEHRGVS